MHHYGEGSTEVQESKTGFTVLFLNKETGQEIIMRVPRRGVLEKPDEEIDYNRVFDLAMEIAHMLRERLA